MDTQNQERDYSSLPDHLQRVVEELNELKNKEARLAIWIGENPTFKTLPEREQHLQKKQLLWMGLYIEVLEERLNMHYNQENNIPNQKDWQTPGEQLIGFFGNENWDVFTLKTLSSKLVDETQKRGKDGRRIAKSGTDVESAAMFAVKSLFS